MTYTLTIHTIIELLDRVNVVANEKPVPFRESVVDVVDQRFDGATLEGGQIGSIVDHGELASLNTFWV